MENSNETLRIGLSIWLGLCFVFCIWFLSSFIKGRRIFQNNLHVIEDGLKRMQEEMEKKQRQRSLGYEEDMKEIADLCRTLNDPEIQEKQEEPGLLDNTEIKVGDVQPEEEDDKKNV